MLLTDYLDAQSIHLDLTGNTKEQVLSELVNMLVARGLIQGADALLEALLEREGLGSTGIGHGVAIPHGRTAEVSQPALVFGRSAQAVEFDSLDGQPARIFFLLVAPENGETEHLRLLAKIAKLMKNAATRERLLTLGTPEEVVALFEEQDAG